LIIAGGVSRASGAQRPPIHETVQLLHFLVHGFLKRGPILDAPGFLNREIERRYLELETFGVEGDDIIFSGLYKRASR